MSLNIHRIPIHTLAEFLEAIAFNPHADMSRVAGFAGFGITTARSAIATLEALALIKRNDGGIECMVDGVQRGMPAQARRLIVRRALQAYRPFALVCEGLALGESETDAIRKAVIVLNLPPDDQKKCKILVEWGVELGVFVRTKGDVTLAPEVKPPTSGEWDVISVKDVESEARARLYIAAQLGRDAHNSLDAIDQQLLVNALLAYCTTPNDSVEDSGQALEDYLRHVAGVKSLSEEARKCNGAGQLGLMLTGKSVIHSHHNQFIQALGTGRNCVAHKKDKKTLKPWDITPAGAFWMISGCLTFIRSVHEYIYGGKQIV